MNIPDDATKYLIAAVVPCDDPEHRMGMVETCPSCDENGLRTVVTDVEVERQTSGGFVGDIPVGALWREVPKLRLGDDDESS